MGLLAPWFLAALAGLGLPLYLHLLKRQTTMPKQVSSLMLFESRTQSSTRHRRLRYFLLLSLRLLWLLLLILAFANPFFNRNAAALASNRLVQPGGGQFLQHACRESLGRCQGRSHQRAIREGRRTRASSVIWIAVAPDDTAHRGPVGVARRRAVHSTRRWSRQLRRTGARRACHGRVDPHTHRTAFVQRYATRRFSRHVLRHGA